MTNTQNTKINFIGKSPREFNFTYTKLHQNDSKDIDIVDVIDNDQNKKYTLTIKDKIIIDYKIVEDYTSTKDNLFDDPSNTSQSINQAMELLTDTDTNNTLEIIDDVNQSNELQNDLNVKLTMTKAGVTRANIGGVVVKGSIHSIFNLLGIMHPKGFKEPNKQD